MRILVLSAESMLAEKMVRTVRKVIEKHPLTKALRPADPDQWAADSFTVERPRISRDPSVLARGLYANITGTRADIILCDDVEVPNTCDTAEKRARLRERLGENEFILTPGGTLLYIGTPHTYYSIYADSPRADIGEDDIFLKNFTRLSLPVLNRNGESAWPERYGADDILKIRTGSGPAKFASQMMLEPVNILQSRLDPALLNRYEEEIVYQEAQQAMILRLCGRKLLSVSAWWDPSFGAVSGDASVVAIVYTDETGDQWIHHMEYISVTAGEGEDAATLQCVRVAALMKRFFVPILTVETNGIGKFLPAILRRELAKAGVACGVQEKQNTKPKTLRILESFDAVMAARSLHVHASVYKTPFPSEMAEWNPQSASNRDDGLDAAAGALSLEPVRLPRVAPLKGKIWSGSGSGHAAVTDFDV